jgi:hypothetical protein
MHTKPAANPHSCCTNLLQAPRSACVSLETREIGFWHHLHSNCAATSKRMHIVAPQPWTRPSYTTIFRHPPRMNHAQDDSRALGRANPSGSCHPSWHTQHRAPELAVDYCRWLNFSIKPAKTHQSKHTKGSAPFSKAQLRHWPSKQQPILQTQREKCTRINYRPTYCRRICTYLHEALNFSATRQQYRHT